MKKFTALLFVMFALTASAFAQIKSIDAYAKSVEKIAKKKKPHLVFADISDYNDDNKGKWRKFASSKSLEKFRTRNETYTIAYNWVKNRRLVFSVFTRFSPSGDWAQYDSYYFRADGKLAKIESELRTFMGDAIINRNFYFNAAGKRIRLTTRYRDLQSKKPIKKPTDTMIDNNDVEVYKTVRQLPFAKLIGKL